CRVPPTRHSALFLSFYLEVGGDCRDRLVENDRRLADREQHGVVPLLHFHDDLVEAEIIDRDQRAGLALELQGLVEDRDLRRNFHGVKVTRGPPVGGGPQNTLTVSSRASERPSACRSWPLPASEWAALPPASAARNTPGRTSASRCPSARRASREASSASASSRESASPDRTAS